MKPSLIWDWDGTLVDTIGYKYDGIWKDVFSGEEEKQKAVIDFLKTPEGKEVNRYGLVKHALISTDKPELINISDDELKEDTDIKSYANKYKKFSEESVIKNGLFPGTKEVLKNLHNNGYSMYIISGGGMDKDLKRMAREVGIVNYFKGIFGFGSGSFTSFGKHENFKRVTKIEDEGNPSRYVFIGDGESDYKLAQEIGSKFLAIPNKWNKWGDSTEMQKILVSDIKKLSSYLSELQK